MYIIIQNKVIYIADVSKRSLNTVTRVRRSESRYSSILKLLIRIILQTLCETIPKFITIIIAYIVVCLL